MQLVYALSLLSGDGITLSNIECYLCVTFYDCWCKNCVHQYRYSI